MTRRLLTHSFNRRHLLRTATLTVAGLAAMRAFKPAAALAEEHSVTATEALLKLVEGNARYVSSMQLRPNQSAAHRTTVAAGQHPFAVVVGSAESSVPPELLFDAGLGDLFVLRVAGNILDDAVIGSIEFGVEEFGIPLVVVLGHERCGAVAATVAAVQSGDIHAPGHIGAVVTPIIPAVTAAQQLPGDLVDNSVRQNALMVAEMLRHNEPLLYELVEEHKLTIIAARYDLDDGTVEFLEAADHDDR